MNKFAAIIACVIALAAAPVAAQRVEQVHFARGASGTTIDASIVGEEYIDYHLTLAAGQMLSVSLQDRGGSAYFNVIEPGAGNVAIYNSSTSGQTFEARTRMAGTYTIRVYQMRASGRRGERASYRLNISATGSGASHSSDVLVSGTPYHATAMIRCVAEPSKPMSSCRAGVTRRGSSATVHVDTPDGGERTILFRGNKAVSSDSDAGIYVERRGDTSVVKIGTVEVYEIPDAFVQGG
ncbi:hypothetical protein [Erythrobacter dokdonensis]|uniref:Peptidase C-terminal archaeal/bacterial domain-containing protein n=1 Tax=Erythrobacter dokdonensis DSW-74 TaxID=1300349 RepID=A0A1A7BH89_9SPHN|nr:hypothetical protein [Erythrobacter dokdonensis]OBV10580.1 hypothetical protein I603_1793 [Erythrobacter dokdonensis DSW-74]